VNEAELRAYGMVAQAIAQHAFAMAEAGKEIESYFPEARGPVCYHYSMSIFEAVANDLWRLRILRPLDQKADWAFHFVFDCDVDQSNRVAERNWQSGPALFDVLVTFHQSIRAIRHQLGIFGQAVACVRSKQPHGADT
jgi:hypothetical protein